MKQFRYDISKPKKIEIVIKTDKRRSFRKKIRTLMYRIRTAMLPKAAE